MRILIDNGNTPAAPRPYIGHYGRLRKAYLEQYRPDLYTALVANEKLHEHCAEIDEAARSRIDLTPACLTTQCHSGFFGSDTSQTLPAPVRFPAFPVLCRP